jgi:hypothetical protein
MLVELGLIGTLAAKESVPHEGCHDLVLYCEAREQPHTHNEQRRDAPWQRYVVEAAQSTSAGTMLSSRMAALDQWLKSGK